MPPKIDHLPAPDALAHEVALLDAVARDPDQRHLWFWTAPQSLVAPRTLVRKPQFQAAAAALGAEGWPVAERSTGGDATPQGPGVVNVTHVYAVPPTKAFDMQAEYDRLCHPIEAALGPGASRGWQPGAFCDGAHNVQWNGLKFAGTAMRFRPCRVDKTRFAVLAHALLLIAPPPPQAIAAINRFLTALEEPRVIDPAAHTGLPPGMTQDSFLTRLEQAFNAPDLLPRPD